MPKPGDKVYHLVNSFSAFTPIEIEEATYVRECPDGQSLVKDDFGKLEQVWTRDWHTDKTEVIRKHINTCENVMLDHREEALQRIHYVRELNRKIRKLRKMMEN